MSSETAVNPAPAAHKGKGDKKPFDRNKGKGDKKKNFAEINEHHRQVRIARAAEDNVEIVSRKTADAGDLVSLINSFDWGMERVRRQMGRNQNLPIAKAAAIIEEGQTLCAAINALNEKMYSLLGSRYEPPRRYRSTTQPAAPASAPPLPSGPAPAAV